METMCNSYAREHLGPTEGWYYNSNAYRLIHSVIEKYFYNRS